MGLRGALRTRGACGTVARRCAAEPLGLGRLTATTLVGYLGKAARGAWDVAASRSKVSPSVYLAHLSSLCAWSYLVATPPALVVRCATNAAPAAALATAETPTQRCSRVGTRDRAGAFGSFSFAAPSINETRA